MKTNPKECNEVTLLPECGKLTLPPELIGKLTTTVAVAASVLNIGLNQAYRSVKDGTIPSIRLQGRYVIPVRPLLALLGITYAP